jgi:hypothetical protein
VRPASEQRFRRLLRWYPRRWRRENGAILLSALLDSAERDGRAVPTAAERIGAVIHGTAARVDRRLAIVLSAIGIAFAILAGVLAVWAPAGGTWLLPSILTGVVPALSTLGLITVLRVHGLIGDGRTLAAMATAVAAFVVNSLTYAAWSAGFDAADEGVAATGLAIAWLPLFAVAALTGATATALVVEALFRRARLNPLARVVVAGLVGIVAAPLIGFGVVIPTVSAMLALGVAVLALLPRRNARMTPSPSEALRPTMVAELRSASPSPAVLSSHATARLLAWIAAGGGAMGVVYALTGGQWSPGAADSTMAMGQGITILLVSALPLLAALGLRIGTGRAQLSRLHRGVPLLLFAISLGFLAIAYIHAPVWDAMVPWFQTGSVLSGAAIAWWVIPRVRMPRPSAAFIGVSAGGLYAAYLGTMLAPMLAFAVPIGAIVVALQRPRKAKKPALVSDAEPAL